MCDAAVCTSMKLSCLYHVVLVEVSVSAVLIVLDVYFGPL